VRRFSIFVPVSAAAMALCCGAFAEGGSSAGSAQKAIAEASRDAVAVKIMAVRPGFITDVSMWPKDLEREACVFTSRSGDLLAVRAIVNALNDNLVSAAPGGPEADVRTAAVFVKRSGAENAIYFVEPYERSNVVGYWDHWRFEGSASVVKDLQRAIGRLNLELISGKPSECEFH
jgi:hypothetical protein